MKQLENSLAKPVTAVPLLESPVKVEEQEKTENSSLLEDSGGSVEVEENIVDDLPTRPLAVADSPKIHEQPLTKSNHKEESIDGEIIDGLPTEMLPVQHSSPTSAANNIVHLDEIEKIFTRPLAAQRPGISTTAGDHVQQRRQAPQAPVEPVPGPVRQRPVTPAPFPQPPLPPAQALRQTPPVSMPVPPVAPSRKRSGKRLMLVFVALFVLLLGGVVTWLIAFRPFAVPEITKTTRAFQNAGLGISLQYPQQWTVEVHEQKGTASFYDDNHTDQVNITVAATGGQSINQYINKVIDSLGMTGQKTEPALAFAGASWQQEQGNVQQSGASYTATLQVTMHGGHYYTILQLAPSSTYIHEDQLVFSLMRSSFRFL